MSIVAYFLHICEIFLCFTENLLLVICILGLLRKIDLILPAFFVYSSGISLPDDDLDNDADLLHQHLEDLAVKNDNFNVKEEVMEFPTNCER